MEKKDTVVRKQMADLRMPIPEEDVTEKQMVGNKSEASSFILKCIRCGESKGLSFIAHRNIDECITGFICVCQTCMPIIGDTKKRIKIVMSSKYKEVRDGDYIRNSGQSINFVSIGDYNICCRYHLW